jgi:hypothetical protein
MLSIFQGRRPDITAAQLAAVLVAGVPVIATLLNAFGVADMTRAQQDALADAVTWSAVVAGLLIGGDATLRAARNIAVAKTDAAAITAGEASRLSPDGDAQDDETDLIEATIEVSDDVEFLAESEMARLEAGLIADDPDYVGRDGR